MKLSVFTASTPEWESAEAASILAEQGWDGIEWRITDQDAAEPPGFWAGNRSTWPLTGLEDSLSDIAAATRDAGLELSGLGGYARCDDHANVARMLAATEFLGASRVRVTMPRTDSGEYRGLFAAARADLEWVASRAAAHGVQALVELHHETITPSASAAFRLVDGLDPAHVGVIHDLGNLVIEGFERHASAFELLGPYLAHVHVKNARWVKDDLAGGPSIRPSGYSGTITSSENVAAESSSDNVGTEASSDKLRSLSSPKGVGPRPPVPNDPKDREAVRSRGAKGATSEHWHHEWAPLRTGQADVAAYIADLVRFGYDGWITVEDFSTDLPLFERTADNLEFLREALRQAQGPLSAQGPRT